MDSVDAVFDLGLVHSRDDGTFILSSPERYSQLHVQAIQTLITHWYI